MLKLGKIKILEKNMEAFIGLVVIFILLFCLGASIGMIATIALVLVGVFVFFMTIIFIYATVILIMGKRAKGRYVRSEKGDKSKIPYAVYLIDETEYSNMFPLEVMFQNKIYREDREVKLILNKKRKRCFDSNAVICCLLGVAVSVFLLVEMIVLLLGNI